MANVGAEMYRVEMYRVEMYRVEMYRVESYSVESYRVERCTFERYRVERRRVEGYIFERYRLANAWRSGDWMRRRGRLYSFQNQLLSDQVLEGAVTVSWPELAVW